MEGILEELQVDIKEGADEGILVNLKVDNVKGNC